MAVYERLGFRTTGRYATLVTVVTVVTGVIAAFAVISFVATLSAELSHTRMVFVGLVIRPSCSSGRSSC